MQNIFEFEIEYLVLYNFSKSIKKCREKMYTAN